MQRCHVTGSTVATQKAAGLTGFSLLTVTPVEGGGELVAVDLRIAVNAIGEIVGKTTTEDLLDNIFSQFCIGK